MSEVRHIGRQTLIYGVGIVASKLVSLVMLPVYTHYLTPADYGVLELLSMTIDLIGMIGGIGLGAGLFKHYADAEDGSARRRLVSTITLGNAGLALAISVLGILLSPLLTRWLFGESITPLYFRLFFLIYFVQSVEVLGLALIQVEERSRLFVILNIAKLVVTLSLNIYFVVFLRWTIAGILFANLIATSVFSIGLFAYTMRRVGYDFSGRVFRSLSEFGVPIVLWTVGSFILTFSDRYFLNYYSGSDAVGLYSLAYKFGFILSTFAVAPFSQIWEPRRFAIAKQSDAGTIYRRMFLYLNLALVAGAVVITLFVKDLLIVMTTAAFVPAHRVVPLILVTTIIQQWTGYCNFGLFLRNATRLYAWSAAIGVVAALTLNALLIPRYGMFGAAWATVITYAIRLVPVYVWSQKKYYIDYPWAKVAWLMLLLGAVFVIRHFANDLSLVLSSGLNLVVLSLFCAVVYRGILNDDERSFVRTFARGLLSFRGLRAVPEAP